MPKQIMDRIVFLDCMRIFAFIGVLVGHRMFPDVYYASIDESLHISLRYVLSAISPLVWSGAAGVIVFFITSGYVITHVLQSENTTEFLIKRFFRIYPLFIFAVICEALVNKFVNGIPLPPAWQWIPHLLLLGDLFAIPTSLSGVEWTLRIEVAFYVLMALFKASGLMRKQQYLPMVFGAIAATLYFSSPFPNSPGLTLGYTTLYAPFLFLGSCIYLLETGKANKNACIALMICIVLAFWTMTTKIQPSFNNNNHSMYALAIFFSAWLIRDRIQDGPLIRLTSNLTYSVYLFHNWAWPYLAEVVSNLGITYIPQKIQIVMILVVICYVLHKTVETYGLRAGRIVAARYRTAKTINRIKQVETASS
jgi:peptidoglycan/LPS O-acetylase OafA/YrhL